MKNFFIIITVFNLIYLTDSNNNCSSNNNCIPITNCPQIREMLKPGLNGEDRADIIDRKCNFKILNGVLEIYVCCPIPLPKLSECGKYCSNLLGKVIGETETHIEEFPWTVLLKTKNGTSENNICEGTLINQRYILTAAHCVSELNHLTQTKQLINITTVRLGEWNKKNDNDCLDEICSDSPVDIDVEKIIPHPQYQPQLVSGHHDIALLRLAKNIQYTNYIQPICLPLSDNLKNDLFDDASFDIVGWGNRMTNISSDIKLKSKVDTVYHTKCARIFYKSIGTNILNSQICTSVNSNIDTCKGDYGGSLIGLNYEDKFDPRHFLAGIISFGPIICGNDIGLPMVYTRVGAYIDWILENLEY